MDERVEQAKAYLGDKWLLANPVSRKSNRPEKPTGLNSLYVEDFHWEGTYWTLLVFTIPGGPGVLDVVDEVWTCRHDWPDERWGRLPLRSMPEGFCKAVQDTVDDLIRWGCVDEC